MCDYCENKRRDALKVNGKIIGHCCLPFFNGLAKCNSRTTLEEINYQTLNQ